MRVTIPELDTDVSNSELFAELVPPAEFERASFDNYFPDESFPSQVLAARLARQFAKNLGNYLVQKYFKIFPIKLHHIPFFYEN
jgi:hypothetical protein